MKKLVLRDLLKISAERFAEKTAVITTDRSFSFEDLFRLSGRIAERIGFHVVREDTVAIVAPNSIEFLASFFACLQLEAVAFPLSPKTPEGELERLVIAAGARCILAAENVRHAISPAKAVVDKAFFIKIGPELVIEEDALSGRTATPEGVSVNRGRPSGLHAARYTSSGSTGKPKHLLRSADNIVAEVAHFCETLGVDGEDLFLAVAPFCHSYGSLAYWVPLWVGGTLAVLPQFLPHEFLKLAGRCRPSVTLLTPMMLDALSRCHVEDGGHEAFARMRHCIVSTAPLTGSVLQRFRERFGRQPVHVQYGSTETGSAAIDLDDDFVEGRVGVPYHGVEIEILDDDGGECQPEKVGRVAVRSYAASTGYENDPEETDRVFHDGYVFPGDMGWRARDGAIHLVGRDDLINIDGLKVDRAEVERIIREVPGILDAAVFRSSQGSTSTVAAVVVVESQAIQPEIILDHCQRQLAAHKIPKMIAVVPGIPRDENGKTKRKVKSKSQGLASEARGGRGEALWFSGRAGCFRWPSPQGRQIEARGK